MPPNPQRSWVEHLKGWLSSGTSFRARRNAAFARGVTKSALTENVGVTPRPKSGRRKTEVPADTCLYAIGDIHGRADLLESLIQQIEADAANLPPGVKPVLIFLGDYIDRGLQSREVLNILCGDRLGAFETVFLLGNHEEALLKFLNDAHFGTQWANYGGMETLFSYGFQPPNLRRSMSSPEAMAAAREAWSRLWIEFRATFPPEHQRFLEQLKPYHVAGDYLFVHAGLRPGVDISDQSTRDMLWIRDEFLDARDEFPWLIVHGHTTCEQVHQDHRRLGIDTAAYITGRLTAARLFGTEIALLST
jgi:serine/threonine protein phosphatase 1